MGCLRSLALLNVLLASNAAYVPPARNVKAAPRVATTYKAAQVSQNYNAANTVEAAGRNAFIRAGYRGVANEVAPTTVLRAGYRAPGVAEGYVERRQPTQITDSPTPAPVVEEDEDASVRVVPLLAKTRYSAPQGRPIVQSAPTNRAGYGGGVGFMNSANYAPDAQSSHDTPNAGYQQRTIERDQAAAGASSISARNRLNNHAYYQAYTAGAGYNKYTGHNDYHLGVKGGRVRAGALGYKNNNLDDDAYANGVDDDLNFNKRTDDDDNPYDDDPAASYMSGPRLGDKGFEKYFQSSPEARTAAAGAYTNTNAATATAATTAAYSAPPAVRTVATTDSYATPAAAKSAAYAAPAAAATTAAYSAPAVRTAAAYSPPAAAKTAAYSVDGRLSQQHSKQHSTHDATALDRVVLGLAAAGVALVVVAAALVTRRRLMDNHSASSTQQPQIRTTMTPNTAML